jgi:hypothetical protein
MEAKEKLLKELIEDRHLYEGKSCPFYLSTEEMDILIQALQSFEWVKVELEKLKTDLEKLKAKRTYEVDVDSMICILRDILTPPNR